MQLKSKFIRFKYHKIWYYTGIENRLGWSTLCSKHITKNAVFFTSVFYKPFQIHLPYQTIEDELGKGNTVKQETFRLLNKFYTLKL